MTATDRASADTDGSARRGALLDLLATGDADRAGAAVAAHLRGLGDGPAPSS